MPPKKEKKPLKRVAIKKKFKASGEKSVFEDVLDNISDNELCKCFVCDTPIALVMPHNFAHVLNKKNYPKMRLEPRNIVLLCFKVVSDEKGNGCHHLYDHTPNSELKGEGWERLFELKEQLKEEYKQIERLLNR